MHEYVFEKVKNMPKDQKDLFMQGYQIGENERIALATANSELRSMILKLSQQLEEYERTS